MTRAELGHEVSLAFADFFYVRFTVSLYIRGTHTRYSHGAAYNVTIYPHETWTLHNFTIILRVTVSRNQI